MTFLRGQERVGESHRTAARRLAVDNAVAALGACRRAVKQIESGELAHLYVFNILSVDHITDANPLTDLTLGGSLKIDRHLCIARKTQHCEHK